MTATHVPTDKSIRSRRAPKVAAAALSLAVAAFGAHSIASATLASGPTGVAETSSATVTPAVRTEPTVGLEQNPAASETSPQLHRPGQPKVAAGDQGGTRWASMAEFMTFVIQNADGYWSNQFVAAGYGEPTTNYYWTAPGESIPGECGPSNDNTAHYCGGSENQITVSQDLAIRVWNGSLVGPDGQTLGQPGGDMGVAMIIAHEVAHSMQDKLGLLDGRFSVPATEQHADCWAGVWTRYASDSGLLDPGDIQEGENAAWLVGDSAINDAEHHHGTSQSRVAAFGAGFNAGYPSACDAILNAPGL
jgi:predicted metalloprotease